MCGQYSERGFPCRFPGCVCFAMDDVVCFVQQRQ